MRKYLKTSRRLSASLGKPVKAYFFFLLFILKWFRSQAWFLVLKLILRLEHQWSHTVPFYVLQLKPQPRITCGNINFPWESTSIWFLYMERVKWIIRFSSHFLLFHIARASAIKMPHSCIYLYAVSIFFNGWAVHFPLRDFHNIFSIPRIAEFFRVADCLPSAMAAAPSSNTEWPGSPSKNCQSGFLSLLRTCGHIGKKNGYITFSLCFIDY